MNVYICIYILNLLMQIVCMYVCIFVYKVLRIAICLRFVLLILFPTCQMVFVFHFVFGFFCFFLRNARFFFPFSTMFVYIIILFSSKLKHKFTLFNLLLLLLLLLNFLHTIVVNFFNNNNNAFVFFFKENLHLVSIFLHFTFIYSFVFFFSFTLIFVFFFF